MKTSVIIPSRGRNSLLAESLRQLRATAEGYEVEAVVILDKDDPEYTVPPGADVLIVNKTRIGAVKSYNRGLKRATGDYVMAGANDLCYKHNWLKYAIEAHQKHLDGYGMIGLNDGAYDAGNCVLFMMDRRFCKEFFGGVLVIPHYQHLFSDTEMVTRARAAGHFYWCEEANVTHLHPAHGTRPADDSDRYIATLFESDQAIFEARKQAGFPNDYEPVI